MITSQNMLTVHDMAELLHVNYRTALSLTKNYLNYIWIGDEYKIPSDEVYWFVDRFLFDTCYP